MSAWIETSVWGNFRADFAGRTLMSAWIETSWAGFSFVWRASRTLMSAWIETAFLQPNCRFPLVALS